MRVATSPPASGANAASGVDMGAPVAPVTLTLSRAIVDTGDPGQYGAASHGEDYDVKSLAGVALGETYPFPMVDHAVQRERAIDRFRASALPTRP